MRAPEAAEAVRIATRTALVRIIDLCLEERVDALIIAGDLYDGEQKSMKTARFFTEQVRRLDEVGIEVFIVRGNHDAESRITREMTLPDGVHVFCGRGKPKRTKVDDVVVHGVSFANRHAPESLLPQYAVPTDGAFNIGVMHTSVGGTPPHDPYAPCSIADLRSHGFDYWALGHIHKRFINAEGPCTIVMPGIPQGRHISEDGPRSVSIVTCGSDRRIEVEERSVAAIQFERVEVDVSEVEDWRTLKECVSFHLGETIGALRADAGVVRVNLTGYTGMTRELRRHADKLAEEVADCAARTSRLFVEKVTVGTRDEPAATRADFGSALARIIEEGRVDSTVVNERVRYYLDGMVSKLPAELRDRFAPSDMDEMIAELMNEGAELVLARLADVGHAKDGAADDAA